MDGVKRCWTRIAEGVLGLAPAKMPSDSPLEILII